MGYDYFEGEGVPEPGDWQPERSLLILGIHCDDAKQLGRKYGQNAIVAGRRTEPAELVICKEDRVTKPEHTVQPDSPPARPIKPSGRESTTQIESEGCESGLPYGNTQLDEIERRIAAVEPHLAKTNWPPMTYMMIPSVLAEADRLIHELREYDGPDRERSGQLLGRITLGRQGFRRDRS